MLSGSEDVSIEQNLTGDDMLYISENMDLRLQNTAVSLGKFDGVHRGHRLLIDRILKEKEKGYTSVVFTFSLHPMSLFSDKELELIDTEEEKIEKLQNLGVDVLISYPFTKETANTEPEDFVRKVLVEQLDAKVIVVGSDYRFGKQRKGDVELLRKLSLEYGYELVVYDKLQIKHHIVSSTLIRNEISAGHMEFVEELLGEPYKVEGEVVYGNQIGRTIGAPTVNQLVSSTKLMPPNGVYASRVRMNGKIYDGVTNIGYKPTVTDKKVKGVETHIFDYEGDLYGKNIIVELLHYTRAEKRFASVDELKQQIQKDSNMAREYLSKRETFIME